MRTSYREGYGGPEVLSVREVTIPKPDGDEIVVQVHAATVSRTDCAVLAGAPYIYRFFTGWPRPRLNATGTDFAGEVVSTGPNVTVFQIGERIMGFDDNNLGTHAEHFKLSAKDAAIRIPDGVSFEAAAASIEGTHYARNFLNKVPLKAGAKVLVYGATGAIGSAAVFLLKSAGAHVTAVCPEEHHPAIRELGADVTLDYRGKPFTAQLQSEIFDCVLDAVGKSSFSECRPLLRDSGAYCSSELGKGGQNLFLALVTPFLRGPKVKFPFPSDTAQSLKLSASILSQGYQPLIDRRYRLDDIQEAFSYVASGRKVGSVVLALAP